jgi:ribonuclease HII
MTKQPLIIFHDKTVQYEIALDEVARGPLFGRVYIAAVVLPKDGSFDNNLNIKDSKKFTSKKKIGEVADFITKNALYYHIHYIEANEIDEINILQAVYKGMHECIRQIMVKIELTNKSSIDGTIDGDTEYLILVDGDKFKPYYNYNTTTETIDQIPHITIEKGDSIYMGIAAASIIAKVAHDQYITDLCNKHPELSTKYHLDTNVGYGTRQHLDGIREHGITQWHRQSYGPCKGVPITQIV